MSRSGRILGRAGPWGPMARWGLLALGVGLALGFGLGSLGLLPVADVDIRWTVPALSVDEYNPEALATEGAEALLVYVGSSTCGWSNTPELPRLVGDLKRELRSRARREGWRFAAVGIAKDRRAADGLAHLEKFGAFDEVMAGHGWANRGVQEFVYGQGSLAGPGVTPQVLVVLRRLEFVADGHISIADEEVLTRKAGLDQITDWIADGAPIPGYARPSPEELTP